MSPRKSVEQELTKDMIIDTARNLFAQFGYQHVSMRKIGQELGYSHGALYYHFQNKAELFYEIVAKDFSLLNDLLIEIINEELTNTEKVEKILLRFIQFGLDYPNHYELMFLTRNQDIQQHLQLAPAESYERFAQSLSTLCGPQVSAQEIWSVFLAMHGFVSVHCRNEQTYEEVRGLAKNHVRFMLKGLGIEEA